MTGPYDHLKAPPHAGGGRGDEGELLPLAG
jgi:hypothetical protein